MTSKMKGIVLARHSFRTPNYSRTALMPDASPGVVHEHAPPDESQGKTCPDACQPADTAIRFT
jgi:hypothetical protein